jgi:hypothetical protein
MRAPAEAKPKFDFNGELLAVPEDAKALFKGFTVGKLNISHNIVRVPLHGGCTSLRTAAARRPNARGCSASATARAALPRSRRCGLVAARAARAPCNTRACNRGATSRQAAFRRAVGCTAGAWRLGSFCARARCFRAAGRRDWRAAPADQLHTPACACRAAAALRATALPRAGVDARRN